MAALDGLARTVNSSQDPTSVSRTPKSLSYHQLQTLQQQKKHKEARVRKLVPHIAHQSAHTIELATQQTAGTYITSLRGGEGKGKNMMKSKTEEERKVHKTLVPSALRRGASLRSTHEATYGGSIEDTGYRIDYNSERLGVSHIIGQNSRLSGVAPPRPRGNPFEEAEDEEDEEDDLDEAVAGLTGNMNSSVSHLGGPGARGRGMVGGGRGGGVPGGMAVPGRNSLPPQVPIPMYNPMTRPVSQVYQQQGGAQGFPPRPPNAPFGGVGSAHQQQMGGGMFAPGRSTAVQNPRRSSAPMLGSGRGGIGNTPLYNSSPKWPPLPSSPHLPTQTAPLVSTAASQSYNNSTYRQQKILETLIQQQEEDNRKRDAMRYQGLQPPASAYSNVSSREGSLLNEPSSNSSNLSLPYTLTPTFQGLDRRSSTSSGATSSSSSVYSRKAREEVFRRQQEEEEIFRLQREQDEQRERLVQDSAIPQRLESLPTSPTTPGSPGAAFLPGQAEHQPETPRSEAILPELEIAPAGTAPTPDRRSSDPPDRPGTATTVVSLPELGGNRADPGTPLRRHSSSHSWSGPGRTDSLGIDRVAARRKPAPKLQKNPDTPPTSPPVSKISTSGAGKKPLQYAGPIGPWFPTPPASADSAKSLPPPTELPGLAATKPNTHCISDDITRRPSVARGHRFNEEHEVQCLSDDIQNGSLIAGEKGILPSEFFDRHQTACISDDLAEVYLGLGEEGEQELQSQMEQEQRLREARRERVCLGDDLSEWHIDRSGLIPVMEEDEGEAPTHAEPYTAEIPMVVEETDARR